ncbi:hypothetical protein VNI00_008821 [Paramarasmius palmivorus]|uniref:Uncharacterized protein n=1 Tax=Paramarasmius palmivorus TaxID=297713 RepID=A0AAW0CRJ7_9AGAR
MECHDWRNNTWPLSGRSLLYTGSTPLRISSTYSTRPTTLLDLPSWAGTHSPSEVASISSPDSVDDSCLDKSSDAGPDEPIDTPRPGGMAVHLGLSGSGTVSAPTHRFARLVHGILERFYMEPVNIPGIPPNSEPQTLDAGTDGEEGISDDEGFDIPDDDDHIEAWYA